MADPIDLIIQNMPKTEVPSFLSYPTNEWNGLAQCSLSIQQVEGREEDIPYYCKQPLLVVFFFDNPPPPFQSANNREQE